MTTAPGLPDTPAKTPTKPEPSRLRLYVARGTPNSTRAEQNLRTALDTMDSGATTLRLEVVDVSTRPKLSVSDGVIVTPTLIGLVRSERLTILGDLSDKPKLELFLQALRR